MARSTVYNDIVTNELYDKVNQENKDLLEEFLQYLQSIGRSELTIINYESDIKIYFIWNLKNNKNKEFTDITKRNIVRYQSWLIDTLKVSSSRIRRLRSAISSMSNFIENILDEDFPDFRNIINKIPAPASQPVREKTVFENEDLEELLNKLVEEQMYQEACCLALAMGSGARKAELTRFKLDYFKDENIIYGSLYKTPEKIKTKGMGGKMLHKYVLVEVFKPYLDLWIKERERLGVDSEYLFAINRRGKWVKAYVHTLDGWAEKFNNLTDKHFYWHSLRHFHTTHLHNSQIPLDVIKQIVGWASVDMVNHYIDSDIDDELGKYFGEEGIKQVEQKSLSDL